MILLLSLGCVDTEVQNVYESSEFGGCTIDAFCENIAKERLAPGGIRFFEDRGGR